ncbi:MAG: hypothetical protein J6Q84_07180 [Kiritimatiellae bacterium]|nr:hypothetical protein [Kiritimatiellia bacterium]
MHIEFAPRGILQIDDAKLVGGSYRNFAGRQSRFNREGDRNFALLITDALIDRKFLIENEIEFEDVIDDRFDARLRWVEAEKVADILSDLGWNIKIKPPREEGDTPFMFLPVKIKFNDRGPVIYLKSSRSTPVTLDEESIDCLDDIDILGVDLDIRPYDWEVNGSKGRTAYLQNMHVVQEIDRFAERYPEM